MGILTDLADLQRRLNSEFNQFYNLQKAPDEELVKDMKDSDFDGLTMGEVTEKDCIDRYRAKCRGRMITAGNVAGELRFMVAKNR